MNTQSPNSSPSSFILRAAVFILHPSSFILVVLLAAACGKKDDRTIVSFWHTQRSENQKALNKIIADFNDSQSRYRVVPQYVGGYDQIYRKMVVNIRAGKPPALVVAYESMVAKYHQARAVVDLDQYLNHPQYGLSEESLADIFPQFIKANRFKHYGNKLLSFPFTKSILMMYHNKGLLEELGFEPPPETWDQFLEMCRAVRDRAQGKRGYAVSIDASTIDAMVYSFCGNVVNETETRTLFDTPQVRGVFDLLSTMINEGSAYTILKRGNDDRIDIANDRTAFIIRSSTTRPYLAMQVEALKKEGKPHSEWDLSIIPHAEGCKPVTVMFGANICMLKTTPEVQRGAWEFIKFFTSTEVTAEWATKSGYLPVRKSALQTVTLRKFFAEHPRALQPLKALPYAVNEPTVEGWQEVRQYIEDAEQAVLSKKLSVDAALARLNEKSNRLLDELHAGAELRPPAYFKYVVIGIVCIAAAIAWRLGRRPG